MISDTDYQWILQDAHKYSVLLDREHEPYEMEDLITSSARDRYEEIDSNEQHTDYLAWLATRATYVRSVVDRWIESGDWKPPAESSGSPEPC